MVQQAEARAPGKIILCGEHAVVYGRPAIALPVRQVAATAVVRTTSGPSLIEARDLGQTVRLDDAPAGDPLAAAARLVIRAAGLSRPPPFHLVLTSTIPVASGLGSGAATASAVIRALALFLERPELAGDEAVSRLAFEIEKLHHGTPSGIDNTVVTYDRPVYFQRDRPVNRIETFAVGAPLHFLIADTGIPSPTRLAVADLRRAWQAAPQIYEALFDSCGRLVAAARRAIETGEPGRLGALLDDNQHLLEEMGVSSAELDHLVAVARSAGALGAKLSGGGRGGNMIALVRPGAAATVEAALQAASARTVLATVLRPSPLD